MLQIFSVGLAALIPLGSGADRWRLRAICLSTTVLAALTYPLFAHWVWGGGWLAQLGVNYGIGSGFLDAGGASTIQTVGGLTALAITWILGPRRGKYSADGMAPAIPGHNSVFVLFGCILALIGWIGLNTAGAILFTGAAATGAALIAINTTLSASASALDRRVYHQSSLRQARRLARFEWLGRRSRRQQRVLRLCKPSRGPGDRLHRGDGHYIFH